MHQYSSKAIQMANSEGWNKNRKHTQLSPSSFLSCYHSAKQTCGLSDPAPPPCQKSNAVRLLSVWWEYSKTAQFINLSIDNSTVRMEHNHARHSFILYFDDSGWEHHFIKPRTFIFCEIYIFYTSLSLLGHRMPGAFLQLSWRRWGSSWTQGHINTHTHTHRAIYKDKLSLFA